MRAVCLLAAVLLGCVATEHREKPTEPAGCCCSYARCSAGFSQADCVAEAEFEGWTYTWHAGACGATDHAPAPDAPPTR